MNDNGNDIYGYVIQNAKDIQTLENNFSIQSQINKSHKTAGILTCLSTMILGGIVWVVSNTVDRLQKRIDELEKEKNTIDIEE